MKKIAFCMVIICLLASCASIKQTGRTIGHTARDVTKKIGHASRDTFKAIGNGTKELMKDIKADDKCDVLQ